MTDLPIDMHCHYLPPDLEEALRRRDTDPRIETLPGGIDHLRMPIGTLQFDSATYTDMKARLDFMDRRGVGRQVLSLPGLFGLDSLPLAQSLPFTRAFNDDLSRLCDRYPERFSGLAALPLADLEHGVEELKRGRRQLGLIGAILPINAFLSRAQADKLLPLFRAAQEVGAHLFIHPGYRPDEIPIPAGRTPAADSLMERRAIQVQTEIAHAMVTLMFSDFLAPFDNVTVQVANLGGTLPLVIERMDHTVRRRQPDHQLPSAKVGGITVDCASLGPRALEAAVSLFGVKQVVLGTDCPIFSTEESLRAINTARIEEADRKRILHTNAAQILKRYN